MISVFTDESEELGSFEALPELPVSAFELVGCMIIFLIFI